MRLLRKTRQTYGGMGKGILRNKRSIDKVRIPAGNRAGVFAPVMVSFFMLLIIFAGCSDSRLPVIPGPGRTGDGSPGSHYSTDAHETPRATEIPTASPLPTPEPTAEPDFTVGTFEELVECLSGEEGGEAGRATVVALSGDVAAPEETLEIKRHATVRLEGHTLEAGTVFIASGGDGSVTFENGTVKAGRLLANAPHTLLVFSGCAAEIEGGTEPDGFYRRLALPGRPAGEGFVYKIGSIDDLLLLIDRDTFPSVTDDAPLRFEFDPPEDLSAVPYVDLPLNPVIWEREGAPDDVFASRYLNVKSYNGMEMASLGLGGQGRSVLGKIDFTASSGLQGTLPWSVRGNVIKLEVPLHVSEDFMKYARLEYDAGEGSVKPNPEAVNADGSLFLRRLYTLTVTDPEGGTRVYLTEISRKNGSIPVVMIETEGGAAIENTEDYVRCRISLLNTDVYGFDPVPYTEAGIRGRGHSTWGWDKKPWKIKFDSGISLFGLHKAKDWVLLANYADKTLIRNTVAFDMARGLSFDFVPHQFPVDVYLNGEYQGVYTMGEHLERNQERVDIDLDYNDPDTGYLMEIGGSDPDDVRGVDYFHAGIVRFVAIKSPKTELMDAEHFKFISEYVTEADNAVKELGDYYEYIDAVSLYDWLIMCELTCNIDTAFRRSCYMTKDRGGKLKMGPLWDFDLAMGNFSRDGGDYKSWAATGREYVGDTWFTYLIRDPKFTEPFKARWFEVRNGILTRAMESIERNAALLDYSQQENFIRWPIWDVRAGFQPTSMKYVNTYEKQIQFLKDWLYERAAWLDGAIGGL